MCIIEGLAIQNFCHFLRLHYLCLAGVGILYVLRLSLGYLDYGWWLTEV